MSTLDWMQVVMLSLHHKRQVTGLLGPGPIISQQQVIILYLQELQIMQVMFSGLRDTIYSYLV